MFSFIGLETSRVFAIVASEIIILGFFIFICVRDLMDKSVVFWQLLISGGLMILAPLVVNAIFGPKCLTSYLFASVPIWGILLFINIKFNKEKRIGKADIDIISCLFSICASLILWQFGLDQGNDYALISATGLLHGFIGYLLMGALVYILIFMIVFLIRLGLHRVSMSDLKKMKVPMLPMLIPAVYFMTMSVMTA